MYQKSKSYTQIALQRFKKDFWGVFCFWIIIVIALIAAFAYFIIPDNSKNANAGDLALRSESPGFKVQTIVIPTNEGIKFSELWFGREQATQHIAINEFHIQQDSIFYKPYSNQPELEDFKALPHLGKLDAHYRNPIRHMGLKKAKEILTLFLGDPKPPLKKPIKKPIANQNKKKPFLHTSSYFYGH